jgi:hypothetical protein
MSTPDINYPDASTEDEEVDCWNCEDKGFYVTVGGLRQPCPECKTGDMFFYHDPRMAGKTQAVREAVRDAEARGLRVWQSGDDEDDGSHEVTEEAHAWHDRLMFPKE